VLIFYVDESGHHSANRDPEDPSKLARGSSEWFILSAVGIRDTTRRSLAEELDRVKRRHFPESERWTATEIKGRHLAETRKRLRSPHYVADAADGYSIFTTTEQLSALEDDLRLVISRYRPIVFSIAIDKQRLIEKYPDQSPLDTAYAFLYRRVALTLQRIYQGEGAVFVADQQEQHEKHFNSGKIIEFRDRINRKGKQRAEYELILDKPLWINTELSSWDRELIQLADLAAFLSGECIRTGMPPEPLALWNELRDCMAVDWKTGEPEGEGLMIFPMPAVWPQTR